MKTRKLLLSALTTMVIGASGIAPTVAKDTDIYLMAPQVARDDAPNVMIILDNSGSMDTIIDATQIGYDPAIDYCTGDLDTLTGIAGANAGKPSDCATISGRIYWSFPSSGSLLIPPNMNSDRWFSSSKNYCLNSASSFASAGYYGSTKIAGWRSGSGNGWKTLSGKNNSQITYVDCEADGSTNGQAAGDNKYPRFSTSTAYNTSGTAFSWGGFISSTTPTLYTSNYMNYWNNPNLVDEISRMDVAKSSVKTIIDANPSLRFGLTVFNDNNNTPHGGRVVMRIDSMSDTRRTIMKNLVDNLSADTHTPLAETLWEAYRYFAGAATTYGNPTTETPHQDSCAQNVANSACDNGGLYDAIDDSNSSYNDGTYISPFKYGCQTAYIIYVTDGDPSNDTNADSNIAGLTGTSCSSGDGCLDNLAGYMHDNDIYTGLPGNQVVSTYTIGFGGGISPEGLALLQQTANRGGGTYNTANNTAELTTAIQGALTDILQVNTSFTSPSLSINAFNKLYNRDEVYFAFFKPSSSVAWDGNVKKFTLCNSTQATAGTCTFGDIVDRNGDAATGTDSKIKDTAVSYWATTTTEDGAKITEGGAGSHILDINSPRHVYTYTGSYTGLTASAPATPFLIGTVSTNTLRSAAAANPALLGLSPSGDPADADSDGLSDVDEANVDKLINWMLGTDVYNHWTSSTYVYEKGSDGTVTDNRWAFASPLHSRPSAITFGFENTLLGVPDPDKPVMKLFVGTNDGAVRMINANSGAEEWAFIPNEMLSSQYALSQDADGSHIAGMDGAPAFWVQDVNNDGVIDDDAGDRVYMYIGMRRGGQNIYAFDLTPSAKMTSQSDTVAPKLMWVIQGGSGDYTRLGQTWSRPTIARIRYACSGAECNDANPQTDDTKSRTVLLFGGGYDINQDNAIPAGTDSMGNAIFMVDPLTGSRLWWASGTGSGATKELAGMDYSIPSDLTVIDTDGDGRMDRLYVGDTGGQLWRIDLATNIATGANGSTSGYVFADAVCARDASNVRDCSSVATQGWRKFFYPPEVAPVEDKVFSSTSLYDIVTIVSGDREDPLDMLTSNLSPVGEAVHNRIFAYRDIDYQKGPPATARNAITNSATEMYDATANTLGTLTGSALQTEINDNFKNKKGWYIDLWAPSSILLPNGLTTRWVGEKGLAKTTISAGVLNVTTFTPANDTTAESTCAASEGVATLYSLNLLDATGAFDLDGDGDKDRSVGIGGGIPSEVVIVVRPGGDATGLVNVSTGSKKVVIGQPDGPQKSFWHD